MQLCSASVNWALCLLSLDWCTFGVIVEDCKAGGKWSSPVIVCQFFSGLRFCSCSLFNITPIPCILCPLYAKRIWMSPVRRWSLTSNLAICGGVGVTAHGIILLHFFACPGGGSSSLQWPSITTATDCRDHRDDSCMIYFDDILQLRRLLKP
jgi:hypothetical protein